MPVIDEGSMQTLDSFFDFYSNHYVRSICFALSLLGGIVKALTTYCERLGNWEQRQKVIVDMSNEQ